MQCTAERRVLPLLPVIALGQLLFYAVMIDSIKDAESCRILQDCIIADQFIFNGSSFTFMFSTRLLNS